MSDTEQTLHKFVTQCARINDDYRAEHQKLLNIYDAFQRLRKSTTRHCAFTQKLLDKLPELTDEPRLRYMEEESKQIMADVQSKIDDMESKMEKTPQKGGGGHSRGGMDHEAKEKEDSYEEGNTEADPFYSPLYDLNKRKDRIARLRQEFNNICRHQDNYTDSSADFIKGLSNCYTLFGHQILKDLDLIITTDNARQYTETDRKEYLQDFCEIS